MGASQRTKGHSWERMVASELREIGFRDARRHLEYQDGEANGIDLAGTGQFKVQCKAMKKQPNVPQVFEEFKGLNGQDIPVVVFKIDHKGKYACFKWEDAKILMAWLENWRKDVEANPGISVANDVLEAIAAKYLDED